jgi:hypothetical protein
MNDYGLAAAGREVAMGEKFYSGEASAQPARQTIILSVADDVAKINAVLSMAAQQIEGIMRRAGLDIPPESPPTAATAEVDGKTDLRVLAAQMRSLKYQAECIARYADGLAQLA